MFPALYHKNIITLFIGYTTQGKAVECLLLWPIYSTQLIPLQLIRQFRRRARRCMWLTASSRLCHHPQVCHTCAAGPAPVSPGAAASRAPECIAPDRGISGRQRPGRRACNLTRTAARVPCLAGETVNGPAGRTALPTLARAHGLPGAAIYGPAWAGGSAVRFGTGPPFTGAARQPACARAIGSGFAGSWLTG